MKRLEDESFEQYKERRSKFNEVRKWFGRTFNFIPIKPKVVDRRVKHEPSNSKGSGGCPKRHKNETMFAFKRRRKECNKRRRERELRRRIILTHPKKRAYN